MPACYAADGFVQVGITPAGTAGVARQLRAWAGRGRGLGVGRAWSGCGLDRAWAGRGQGVGRACYGTTSFHHMGIKVMGYIKMVCSG